MSKNYRAKWHDYKTRCIYHITLMKPGRKLAPVTPLDFSRRACLKMNVMAAFIAGKSPNLTM